MKRSTRTTVRGRFLHHEGREWLISHLNHDHQGYGEGDDVELVVAHEVAHGSTSFHGSLSIKVVYSGLATTPHDPLRLLQVRQGQDVLRDRWDAAVAAELDRRERHNL